MKPNFKYAGLFLSKSDKDMLIEKFKDILPENWKIFCDHMTSVFNKELEDNAIPVIEYLKKYEDKKFNIEIESIGISKEAIAFGIKTNVPSLNKYKHITFAIAPGHAPVESNYIKNWNKLANTINVEGIIKFIY